ncbi:NAD(P)/FAD-dependent oxidoreductase [Kaarinaea lacus]
MQKADVVIVGAGFAGLACAQATAERGLSTVVLEKKNEPGAYPHTTGIVVKEAAQLLNIPASLTKAIHGVRLYSPSLQYLDLHSPGYYFLATDTSNLMRWLAKQALSAGVTIRYNSSFQRAREDEKYIYLNQQNLKCRYLVGCDGAYSQTAKIFSLGRNTEFLFGVEAEYVGIEGLDEDYMHVFLDSQLAPGYIAWVVPGVGVTQVGLAVRRPEVPKLDNFIYKLRELFDFSRARVVGHRAGLIPCGGSVQPFARPGVMLLGDSAGMVSPLTAGGIHPALDIGRYAGAAIADHLLENANAPELVIEKIMPKYQVKKSMRWLFDTLPLRNAHYDLLLRSYLFRSIARTLFFHHRGLFSLKAWQEIARDLVTAHKS